MIRDQLEFAISQYLDGTLPEEERRSLELRVAADPGARRLLEEHQALQEAMKDVAPLPKINWALLSQRISAAVTGQMTTIASETESIAQSGMARSGDEEVELAVMRYVDGDLPVDEQAAMKDRLASDPSARQLLAEHRSLHTLLKHAWPMPHVDFEQFGARVSEAVAEQAAPASYSISAYLLRYAPRVAVAACLLMIMALAAYFAIKPMDSVDHGLAQGGEKSVLIVDVSGPEVAQGPVVLDIQIGEPQEIASTGVNPYATETLLHGQRRMYAAAGPRWPSEGTTHFLMGP